MVGTYNNCSKVQNMKYFFNKKRYNNYFTHGIVMLNCKICLPVNINEYYPI